jgi:hypothetical protein
MKLKLLTIALAGFLLAGPASAAVLAVDGGSPSILNGNFSLGAETGLASGDVITRFDSVNAASGGLSMLEGPGKLTFEYLGSEAGYSNAFYLGGALAFLNKTTAVGATKSVFQNADGLIDFAVMTTGGGVPGGAVNGGPITGPLLLGYSALADNSLILLFGDGYGDLDLDDLAVRVSVSEVPLPAAAWLLISAILGLISVGRVRRAKAA